MSILINILLVINVFVCLLIILMVLMQRPKNEGLGAAFGGGMTDNLFGAQTTNVLQTITRWLGAIFFILALTLSFLYVKKTTAGSSARKILSEETVPAPTPVPAATPKPEEKKPVKVPAPEAGAASEPVKVPAPEATAPGPGKAPAEAPASDAAPADAAPDSPAPPEEPPAQP